MPHIQVKELPKSIQSLLHSLEYFRKDIEVKIQDTVSLHCSGSEGRKGFSAVLNLSTGEKEVLWGSWGGANMFVDNRVDSDTRSIPIGENVAVIKGSQGHHGTWATIYIGKNNVLPCLPSGEQLPLKQRQILYCFNAIKAGTYRKEELARVKATYAEIDALVESGHLKKDGRGIQITTLGKNANEGHGMPRE